MRNLTRMFGCILTVIKDHVIRNNTFGKVRKRSIGCACSLSIVFNSRYMESLEAKTSSTEQQGWLCKWQTDRNLPLMWKYIHFLIKPSLKLSKSGQKPNWAWRFRPMEVSAPLGSGPFRPSGFGPLWSRKDLHYPYVFVQTSRILHMDALTVMANKFWCSHTC